MRYFTARTPWIAAAAAVVASIGNAPMARADVVSATYEPYSVGAPTKDHVFICHGFGCKFRTEVALSAADHGKLAQILGAGRASAAAERRAVAQAWAWFDRRIGPVAGTQNHVARAGYDRMFEQNQFDCIDASRNTTSLLLVLEQLKLLRHHTVDEPQSRGIFLDGREPHYTAVLAEKTGEKWAVDSWTRGYGQPAEVMTLSRWLSEG